MKLYRIILLSIVVCFTACRKDIDDIDQNPGNNPPATFVNGSVLGLITDESGNPLEDATVTYDGFSVSTDEFGNFLMNNQSFNENATSIKVTKEGYFNSSRTFYPRLNETNHITLTLMDKVSSGTITPGNSTTINTEGVSIDFTTPSFVDESGASHTGNVNVFVRWLNPTADNLNDIMPGDLVGLDTNNDLNALQSFGMIAVELASDNGDYLQLAEGTTAQISLDVPAEMQGNAPASIPLWHFDEDSGLWEEEGEATLEGGKYVGSVSHFSFWNCDAPFPLITLSGFVNGDNGGIQNLKVKITDLELDQSGYGLTSDRGFFIGKVPEGHALLIEILGPCGNVLESEEIGPYTEDTEIAPIFVSTGEDVNISGNLSNCNGDAITQGYVHITFESGNTITVTMENDQTFSTTLLGCENDEMATAVGIDISNSLVSAPTDFNMSGDPVLNLEACEVYYEPGIYVDYNNGGGFEATGSGQDSLIAYTYQVQDFGTHKDYEITVLDWLLGEELLRGNVIVTEGSTDVQYDLQFLTDGFSISGVVTGGIVNQGVELLHVSDTNNDIEIVDSSLYDPSITEVEFTLNIEL